MTVKRDSVNRENRTIKVTVPLSPDIKEGDVIILGDVVENEIVPDIKDPMAGFGQPGGSNYGDAVFDAMSPDADTVFDPMM